MVGWINPSSLSSLQLFWSEKVNNHECYIILFFIDFNDGMQSAFFDLLVALVKILGVFGFAAAVLNHVHPWLN